MRTELLEDRLRPNPAQITELEFDAQNTCPRLRQMRRIGCLILLSVLFICIPVVSNSDMTKPVTFYLTANPQAWAMWDKPSYLVITEKNWPSYYSREPQGADFTANIYIVASLGLKPNPGYTVRILQLQRQGEVINVKIELGEPDPNKLYIQIMVKPIAVAEVPKPNLQLLKQLGFVFVDQKGKEFATVKTEIP